MAFPGASILKGVGMNVTVVYESRYGNTARIARAIAGALEGTEPVRVVEASEPTAFNVRPGDLLFVGGPTEGHGVSPTLRCRLDEVPAEKLKNVAVAAFDTRLNWPAFLAGSAAHGIARILQQKGGHLVLPPESFLVTGMKEEVHLVEGEIDRAGTWAVKVHRAFESPATAATHGSLA
jgi:flavodoxin